LPQLQSVPLSSEYGTHEPVRARFWPWLSGKSLENVWNCSLFARKRHLGAKGRVGGRTTPESWEGSPKSRFLRNAVVSKSGERVLARL
jgi:hypothetical protein